jgi:hypothetical protein
MARLNLPTEEELNALLVEARLLGMPVEGMKNWRGHIMGLPPMGENASEADRRISMRQFMNFMEWARARGRWNP